MKLNKKGNNSKRHLEFVPGNVLSESNTYLFNSTAINIAENGILTLPWPSPSQDLNIIENFWKVIKIALQSELLKSKPNQI
jgi:hypothetical protein